MRSKRDVEVADTLTSEGEGRSSTADGPPVGTWDRYEMLELLGEGGMGSVYKARDRRLGRTLAIKFIRRTDPNLMMRFLREARAQARLDHPNICRIYDVGEVEGRVYLAIQFVDGEPLHKAAVRMSFEDRLAVIRDVALAIHEAHRRRIVHRDLKPANIMIERSANGHWSPVVMDFGLAREATVDAGLSESGVPLGTPAYMSPEQARGDLRAIDQRSDIYSLGATLYELVTGRPPFVATSLADALALAINDDPPAPRSVVASLPVDVETIVLKCLAKDPSQRYGSARALADDLGRHLDGEPILGRRLSLWQRTRLRARRHRALVILGGWFLAALVVVAAFGVRAWLSSRSERSLAVERTRLAERLGKDAKEIEVLLSSAYQMPLHDTRADRARVRDRMRAIAATPRDLGELGEAVIHEALGRGHIALHEWPEAARELELAAMLDTPELHAARGRTLGALYKSALDAARRSGDKVWLARREQELAQQYLTPALADLQASREAGEDAGLLEARIALYRRDFAAAEHGARVVAERAPWLFEARELVADAAYGAALAAFDRGDYDAARPALDSAVKQYAAVSEIARSDASVYRATAETWLKRGELEFRQGRSPRDSFEQALEVLDLALHADPDDAPSYTTKAYVLLRWYQTPALQGTGDQRPILERIEQAAARAVEVDPHSASAWDALGNARVHRGRYEAERGRPAVPWWTHALDDIGKALAIQPDDPWANNDLGIVHRWLGADLAKTGRDPVPEYRAALRSYNRAAEIDPQYLYACANQTDINAALAEYSAVVGIDPQSAVNDALRVAERCLALDRNYFVLLETLARAEVALAHYLVDAGGDPMPALTGARGHLDRAVILRPEGLVSWFYRLAAANAEAKFRLREGADPTSAIAAGRAALAEFLPLTADCAECLLEVARFDLVDAGRVARSRAAPTAQLRKALADAEKAFGLDDQLAEARLTAAEACLQLAITQRSQPFADRGLSYVRDALLRNPRLAGAPALRDALSQARARSLMAPAANSSAH